MTLYDFPSNHDEMGALLTYLEFKVDAVAAIIRPAIEYIAREFSDLVSNSKGNDVDDKVLTFRDVFKKFSQMCLAYQLAMQYGFILDEGMAKNEPADHIIASDDVSTLPYLEHISAYAESHDIFLSKYMANKKTVFTKACYWWLSETIEYAPNKTDEPGNLVYLSKRWQHIVSNYYSLIMIDCFNKLISR